MPVTIVLADHHRMVREGLRALLETEGDFHLVGEAATGEEAVQRVERRHPNILVLELRIAGLSGLEAIRQVRERAPRTGIIVLSVLSGRQHVQQAAQAGAAGYVMKASGAAELIQAIRTVAAGGRYFSSALGQHISALPVSRTEGPPPDPFLKLTPREREVVQLTIDGYSSHQIGARLSISPRTVESHRANVMRKLGVRNVKELIRQAMQQGISPEKP